MSTLRRAIETAEWFHKGQTRIGGDPFITHPQAVAEALSDAGAGSRILQIAWLHDVVEDTPCTLQFLRFEGFSPLVLDAIDALTRREGEVYADYIGRVGQHPEARAIKPFDLRHNLSTLGELSVARGASQRKRYERALADLERPLSYDA